MNHVEALDLIRQQFGRMDALYGRSVFDEWALLKLEAAGKTAVLGYAGPRAANFSAEAGEDARALREAGAKRTYEVGDFEFVHDAEGAHLDAFLRAGPAVYVVCNHTAGTMADVRADARWRQAQVAWFNLAEKFRANPVL